MEIIVLECPRCRKTKIWNRTADPEPGFCSCFARCYWKVYKEPPEGSEGFVLLITNTGPRKLVPPYYR